MRRATLYASAVCLTAVLSAFEAAPFTLNGIEYVLISSTEVSVADADVSLSGSVVIPEKVTDGPASFSVTAIEDKAFENCSGITSVEIPKTVRSIGNDAFSYCSALTEVVLADGPEALSVGYIPNLNAGLFADTRLSSLYLGRDLTYTSRRGYSPFSGLRTLATATIGEVVGELGGYMFSGCASLSLLEMKGRIPPAAAASAFDGVDKDGCRVMVPVGAVETYRSAGVWSDFRDITDGTSSLENASVSGAAPAAACADGRILLSGIPSAGARVRIARADGGLIFEGVAAGDCAIAATVGRTGVYVVSVECAGSVSRFKVAAR